MIRINDLTMDYGTGPILEHVNLHVAVGEAVSVIGGSGCGKSTLLRCINRLVVPTAGEILIDGENILDKKADLDGIRRKMGMVYQHFNLFSHLNVMENMILAPVKVAGADPDQAREEAKSLLAKVGMSGKEDRMPSDLSGGQKQRVAIARTLAMHPELILFDEPTSALDPTMVDEVESVIQDLVREGMTSVIVTHEMRFARNVSDRIVFLAEKGVYEQGPADDFFDNPKKSLTRRFLYRSRMLEQELRPEELDLYSLVSDLRAFLSRFERTSAHDRIIAVVCDELIAPVVKSGQTSRAVLRLICSATSGSHTLMISFPELDRDPLAEPFLDDLNRTLLEHYASFVFSRKGSEGGWEVCVQM